MPDATRLAPDCDLTIYTAAAMKQQLCTAIAESEVLELDLSRVGEIDSAGLQLLAMAKREAQRLDRRLAIVAHSPAVSEVIEFYNLAAFFGDPVVIPAACGDQNG